MKNIIRLLLTVACIVGLLTACSEKNNNTTKLAFSLDTNRNYTGFSNLHMHDTVEDAKKNGYVVVQDSVVIANNEAWINFVETAAQGNNSSIRIASFSTEEDNTSSYYSDVFFKDCYYYLIDSSSDKQNLQPFSYLLTLEGKFGSQAKDSRVVVLTNDNALTFNVVMKSLLSSSMEYKQSVPSYRLVMFFQ